jgi:hypothetical protein
MSGSDSGVPSPVSHQAASGSSLRVGEPHPLSSSSASRRPSSLPSLLHRSPEPSSSQTCCDEPRRPHQPSAPQASLPPLEAKSCRTPSPHHHSTAPLTAAPSPPSPGPPLSTSTARPSPSSRSLLPATLAFLGEQPRAKSPPFRFLPSHRWLRAPRRPGLQRRTASACLLCLPTLATGHAAHF